jgi:hypothetical protein
MMIQMFYAVTCGNHEVQNRLALTMSDWAENLNRLLAEKGKHLLTIDRAESKLIEGSIEVSDTLRVVFPDDQLDDDRLSTSLVLNGIEIEIPMLFQDSQTLSLMFIQAKGAPYDGIGVILWKPKTVARTFQSQEEAEVVALIRKALDMDFDKPNGPRPDWSITVPSFYPRHNEEWLARLLAALKSFDPNLYLEENRTVLFRPLSPQYPVDPANFYVAMQALADEYLESIADDGSYPYREAASAG